MKVNVKELSTESFAPFGAYINMYDKTEDLSEEEKFCYYPDSIGFNSYYSHTHCFCIYKANPMPMICKMLEYHSNTDEPVLVLDGDIVGIFGLPSSYPEEDNLVAFYIKKGTFFVLKTKIWHGGYYPAGDTPVFAPFFLPPFTFYNDAIQCDLSDNPILVEYNPDLFIKKH